MACTAFNPVGCAGDAVSAVAGAAAGSLGNSFADAMRGGASWVITTTIGWWIQVPSIDLTTSPAGHVRDDVWWLSLVVAAAGLAWQGARMAITHRMDPLLDVGRGLITLALWAAIGITGPALALHAGDAFSSWVLDRAASGQVSERLITLASLSTINSAGAVIVLGLVMMIAGLVQAVLMMFREGAVVVLAGVLVLAAAGNLTNYGRPWLMKVLGWMLALITYKPVAALVYAVALTLTGQGSDPRTVLVGLAMMAMSVVALPALMKFFTWATGTAERGGGAGALAGMVGLTSAGIQAAGALRAGGAGSDGGSAGGDGGASSHAAALRHDLGPAASSPTGAAASTTSGTAASAASGGGSAAMTTGATGGIGAVVLAAGHGAHQAARKANGDAAEAMDTGRSDA